MIRLAVGLLFAIPVFAQMTKDQRQLDFQQLAALYAKQYAPYEWKRDGLGFDLLKLGPWLERVDGAKDDLEFLDICAAYVASLRDGHSQFYVPSNFAADNGLFIDIYDGKAFVDLVNRRLLPARDYPIDVGDEVISVDGKSPEVWIREYSPYVSSGNRRATERFALDLVVFRPQAFLPRAPMLAAQSRYVIRKPNGAQQAYDIPWVTSGDAITAIGPVPSPTLRDRAVDEPQAEPPVTGLARNPYRGLRLFRNARVRRARAIKGYGALTPPFGNPAGFTQRLGRAGRDLIYSGTYMASGKRIGFVRIPEMYGSFSASLALNQLVQEVAFFERNTDGLVVDVMRNPGGDTCFTQDAISLFMPARFRMPGIEIRATREWIARYESEIEALEFGGAPQWYTDILTAMLGDIKGAYSENRGRTGPLPICDISLDVEPARDVRDNLIAYTKPLIVLTDELSASAAEIFAGAIQDNDRGKVFGTPTMGAGGTVSDPLPTGWYSETSASVTQSLIVRPRTISSGGEFPAAPYIENIGVRPDMAADLMTRENLMNNGRTFVEAFTSALVALMDP